MHSADSILAAGGIVWRDGDNGKQVAIVHRPGYDDWTLPKGKLDPGESFEEGALREVKEEIGCTCKIIEPIGELNYQIKEKPKRVKFYQMCRIDGTGNPLNPNEIDEILWLPAEEAMAKLDRDSEKEILAKAIEKMRSD